MNLKRIAACFATFLLFSTNPALAQSISIPIPIPIPSIALPFFGHSRSAQQTAADPREEQFVRYWNEGVAASRAENHQRAIEMYRRALAIHPETFELRLYLAQQYRQIGITQAAIGLGKELISMKPREEGPWRLLVEAYIDSNKLDDARATAEEFIRRFPGSRYRKSIEIELANIDKEVQHRSDAPMGLSSSDDNYLSYACEDGLFRWPLNKMPLKVCIASGRGVRKWKDDYIDPVRSAFDQWQIASSGMVSFVEVGNESDADILVVWDDGSKDLGHSGHAGPDDYDDSWIKHAKITLHTQVPHMHSEVTTQTVLETAEHEIGHALGLLGHSDRPDDMMYWSATPTTHRITGRDVRTLMRLYAVDQQMLTASANTNSESAATAYLPDQSNSYQSYVQPQQPMQQQQPMPQQQQPAGYAFTQYQQYQPYPQQPVYYQQQQYAQQPAGYAFQPGYSGYGQQQQQQY